MKFYYVTEDNVTKLIEGSNKQLYEGVLSMAKKEDSNLGVVGVIDKKKLKATLVFHCYKKNVHTIVTQFIRKYAAVKALEELCK